jgi:hypothetical protein
MKQLLDIRALPPLLEDGLTVLLYVPLHIRRQLWLRQHGANPHSGRYVTISKLYDLAAVPVAWPPRSPDLTPSAYYLWVHTKSLVYAVKSITKAELLNRIMDASAHKKQQTLSYEVYYVTFSVQS